MENVSQVFEEVVERLKGAGVGTYMVVVKDPDSDVELYATDGSRAWLIGQCELMKEVAVMDFMEEEE